jgi:hypothetical protein
MANTRPGSRWTRSSSGSRRKHPGQAGDPLPGRISGGKVFRCSGQRRSICKDVNWRGAVEGRSPSKETCRNPAQTPSLLIAGYKMTGRPLVEESVRPES